MIELMNVYGDNKYHDRASVGDLIKYAAKGGDTGKVPYTMGILCSNDYRKATEEFLYIQEYYSYKNPAMKVRHLIIAPERYVSPEVLVQWAFNFGYYFEGKRQVFFGIDISSGRPHIHAIVNTVSCTDGKIYYSDYYVLKAMKEYLELVTGDKVVAFNKCANSIF